MISLGAQALLVPGCEVCADASALHGCGMAMTGLDDQQCSDTLFQGFVGCVCPLSFFAAGNPSGMWLSLQGCCMLLLFLGLLLLDCVYRMPNAVRKMGEASNPATAGASTTFSSEITGATTSGKGPKLGTCGEGLAISLCSRSRVARATATGEARAGGNARVTRHQIPAQVRAGSIQ